MARNSILLKIFCVFAIIIQANGERTKDKMYEKIDGAAACFRRLNSTHQTGCTSNRPGSTGVIHIIEDTEDLNFVLKVGNAEPYMPVLPINQLTPILLSKFKKHSERIAGIIVHKNISRPTNFSHEAQCPNENYGLKNSCSRENPWNPYGTGILQEDLPFPIFLIQDIENLEKIEKCFKKFNDFDHDNQYLRSLCALELSSFMFATKNSQTCLRRSNSVTNFTPTRFCDPLGDKNVWSTLFPWENKTNRVSDVILLTARMDTTSLFNEITPGAISPLTGLVTLLSTAFLLKKMVAETENYKKNVFFVLFNGESYDYIGSQRFVYDILKRNFPMEQNDDIKNQVPQLNMSDIKLIVELGQLSKRSELFTHHIKYDIDDSPIKKFTNILSKHASKIQINIKESKNLTLPPASLQSFLVEDETIQGLVISDHDQKFTNEFYNSIYDDHDNINYNYFNISSEDAKNIPKDSIQRYISNVATMLAESLHEEITGNQYIGDKIEVAHIVDELLHCYLDTANCSIYKAVGLLDSIDDKPLSLYVGVEGNSNIITALTGLTLAWLTGDVTNITKEDCIGDPHQPVYQYVWMSKDLNDLNKTVCYKTTMNFTLAVSPAFVIDGYDWSSRKYSSWTESVWKDLYVRMFLKPSHRHEIMTISVGTVTLVLSMALVYFAKSRSDILFAKPVSPAPGTSC